VNTVDYVTTTRVKVVNHNHLGGLALAALLD